MEVPEMRPTTAAKESADAHLATWDEERVANELKVKLGIRVSPRTVSKYLKGRGRPNRGNKDQRWASFVRNQANVIVACDFFVSVSL